MVDGDLLQMTIAELAPKIRAGEVSPVEVTTAALERASALQPALNSFITLLSDQAMAQAREEEEAISRGEYKGRCKASPSASKTTWPRRAFAQPWAARC